MSVPDKSIDPRLLNAAKKVFLKKGFEMASLAEICQTAGVTTGALYKRYRGKEELFAEVVSKTIREMKEFVSSLEEARAAAVDFDGSISYFPDLASNKIYTKQINVDGTASLKMYEFKEIPTVEQSTYVTKKEFDSTLTEIKKYLEKME